MTTNAPAPDVLAMIVCDQIITDRLTGKQSLIGMFSKIHTRGFPAAHPQLSVFVALTDGHGKSDLTIRIVDSNDSRPPLVRSGVTVALDEEAHERLPGRGRPGPGPILPARVPDRRHAAFFSS